MDIFCTTSQPLFLKKKKISMSISMAHQRLVLVAAILICVFGVFFYRILSLMVLHQVVEPYTQKVQTPFLFSRANILDRNGEVLATSLRTASLYANTYKIIDVEEVVQKLHSLFSDVDPQTLRAKLTSEKNFVWLKRNLTPKQQESIQKLGLPGLYFQREDRRMYPHGSLFAHVLGMTDVDQNGVAGVEKFFDLHLKNQTTPLHLSLDVRAQSILYEALQAAIKKFSAKGANGVIMDVGTSEVLAMVNLPDFNPNRAKALSVKDTFNNNTLGVYEMGSIFKIFTMAMALESEKISLGDVVDARLPLKVGKFLIKDFYSKNRILNMAEAFIYSSNIGMAKIVRHLGIEAQKDFLKRLGFFAPVAFELPEIGTPLLPKNWGNVHAMTISYGYGVALSPLQLANAASAMLNGGVWRTPSLLKKTTPESGQHVIRKEHSETLRKLLYLSAVQGTGRKAAAPGYVVGAKTGTANKNTVGGYKERKNLTSAVAAFPMHHPKYLILITVDEPQPIKETQGFITGGWVAAPVVKEVINKLAPVMGILPVDLEETQVKPLLAIQEHKGQSRVIS